MKILLDDGMLEKKSFNQNKKRIGAKTTAMLHATSQIERTCYTLTNVKAFEESANSIYEMDTLTKLLDDSED